MVCAFNPPTCCYPLLTLLPYRYLCKHTRSPHPAHSYSTRCLEVFHDAKGFFLGSIEGRVNVQYHPEAYANNAKKSFTFKCHRVDRDQPPPTT